MKAIISIVFGTIGMHTENAYIALGCVAIVLILIAKKLKK